jgi:hypothetical protein
MLVGNVSDMSEYILKENYVKKDILYKTIIKNFSLQIKNQMNMLNNKINSIQNMIFE